MKPSNIKYNLNDRVRIKKLKKTFENKYDTNWSREIFVISDVLNTRPVTYKIRDLNNEDVEGSFYYEDLQKTKF